MTDTRIAHAFPTLSEDQALLARLCETLEMAQNLEIAQRDMKKASGAELQELIESAGLPEEIEGAEKAARAAIIDILSRISEHDLEAGRDKGFLSPDDYREALKAKRTLSLARGRTPEKDRERDA